jgi:hypothetical protein
MKLKLRRKYGWEEYEEDCQLVQMLIRLKRLVQEQEGILQDKINDLEERIEAYDDRERGLDE